MLPSDLSKDEALSNGLRFILISIALAAARCLGAGPIICPELSFSSLQFHGEVATLSVAATDVGGSSSKIVVADGALPVGLFHFQTTDGVTATFQCENVQRRPTAAARCRAWKIAEQSLAAGRRTWPAGAEFLAPIESVGPLGQTGWLSIGSDVGCGPGDAFWLLRNGQPLVSARVVRAERDIAFVRFTPLAEGASAKAGDEMRLWPRPFDAVAGRAESAVCFVEPGAATLLWIAAPPPVATPAEPRVDLFRDGEYVGHAIVERRDERFWFARPVLDACARTPRVGDLAVARTVADVRARRFTARVFDHSEDGYLITASEADGLKPGQIATAYRDARELGLMRVTRVQAGYAAIQPVSATDSLKNLDEILFRPRPHDAEGIATVMSVIDGVMLQLQITGDRKFTGPLTIRRDGQAIGAGQILVSDRGAGLGVVLPRSLTVSIQPRDVLTAESD